jgi:molybdopterin molybdotransferase
MGAWAEFRGLVRGEENGQAIAGLEYEAYSPMAEREMRRILADLTNVHPCLFVRVIHRIGFVPTGEAAIYIGIAGRHRAEAFAVLGEFMDRLKQDVPIWKRRAIAIDAENTTLAALDEALAASPSHVRADAAHNATEVLAVLRKLCLPLDAERVALVDAGGRILREAACAREDQPPFDRASVDGYAVRLDDESEEFHIVDEIRAGDWKPRTLQPGEAVRVATGGALPCHGVQVVMKEDVQVEEGRLAIIQGDHERNIRFQGEDARAGQELVSAGSLLEPGGLSLLASLGHARPLVTRLPRVFHVATGNEIVSPEKTPGRGQIRDSNSTLVRSFLGQWGIIPEQCRAGEDEEMIRTAIGQPPVDIDLLLISGGASVGEHDFTRGLLERAGFTILVNKTTARPGKPLIVAGRGKTLAFGLPGNPLAHFVCLNLYVRAALEAWSGQNQGLQFHAGILAEDLRTGGNSRETFWPGRCQLRGGAAAITPLRWASSGDLTALATANALIRVAKGEHGLASGSRVQFVSTNRRV